MINISSNNDKNIIQINTDNEKSKIVEVTNNMAKFYADLAKKSETEIKEIIADERYKSVIENIINIKNLGEKTAQIDFLAKCLDEHSITYKNISEIIDNLQKINTITENINSINQCSLNINDINSASTNAIETKKYAIGQPEEPQEHSAKYWAEKSAIYNNNIQSILTNKQDTLISGNNIKTINNNSILGNGNLEFDGLPNQDGQEGKFLTTDGSVASWTNIQKDNNYFPNIFDIKWSDHIINDIQWLRADTFSWQSGDIYTTAYNTLLDEYNTGIEETEGSVTFKRTTNGFKIALPDQEEAILNKYNTDGIAWYYILDTDNHRFKLPRTKFGFEGLRNNVGNDIAESLPNIKGYWESSLTWNQQYSILRVSGLVSSFKNTTNSSLAGGDWKGSSVTRVDFNANNSSSTYQDNAPVQERATQMYLYFYVGEYTREAIVQTAGITSEQLNKKLDVPTRYVVETSSKSLLPSWYTIYSDNWCEQGGEYTTSSEASNEIIINMIKNYKDTTYGILVLANSNNDINTNNYSLQNSSIIKNTSSFKIDIDSSSISSFKFNWQTSGYLN